MSDSDIVDKVVSLIEEPWANLMRVSEEQIVAQWDIGRVLADETEEAVYGDRVMEKIASRLGMRETKLYDMRQLAQWWPTRKEFDAVLSLPAAKGDRGYVTAACLRKIGQQKMSVSMPPAAAVEKLATKLHSDAVKLGATADSLNRAIDAAGDQEGYDIDVQEARGEVDMNLVIADMADAEPWRSDLYLDFVRSQGCCVCEGVENTQAHHIKPPGVPLAMGDKVGDEWTIPLCPEHHQEFGVVGATLWEARHGTQWAHLGHVTSRGIRASWRHLRKS